MNKKVHIRTFGCQMNARDSEALTGLFLKKGYRLTDTVDTADVVVLNSCAVRDNAQNRAVWTAATLKRLKNRSQQSTVDSRQKRFKKTVDRRPWTVNKANNRDPIICFVGCVAQRDGEELFKKYPHIDLILGPGSVHKTVDYVEKIRSHGGRIIDIKDVERNEAFYKAEYRDDTKHAQVVISTGCSNFCTYCVVPSARGGLRLRNPEDILAEVQKNVESGRTKIMLLGQNVNDYMYRRQSTVNSRQIKSRKTVDCGVRGLPERGPWTVDEAQQNIDFVELLRMVEQIPGIEEIKFVTSHPKNTSKALFELMAKSSKILKDLHLPFQAGSDKILKKMNRGYTRKEYLALVRDYRKIVKGSLGADVIVGFPGETEKDFMQTKDIMEKVRFEYAFIYKYSVRGGTAAERLKDDVPEKEKERRHKILLDLQREIASNKNKRIAGSV